MQVSSKPDKASKSLLQELRGLARLWPDLRAHKFLILIGAVLIPVISLIEMNVPLAIRWTIDEGVATGNTEMLLKGALFYLALVVSQYLFRSAQTVSTAFAVHRMIKSLRKRLVAHIMELSCSYHDRSMSGTLVTRATSDFDNLSESLNMGVLTSLVDIAVLTGSIIGLFYLDWRLALCSLVILPVVGVVVSFFSKSLKSTMLRARRKIAALNAFTQECLFGIGTIKLLTAEKNAQEKYTKLNSDYRKAQMGSVVLDAFMFSIIDGLTSITIGIILFFAVTQLAGTEAITAGIMVAFVQYIQQMFEPLKHLSNKIAMLQGAFTSIDRIFGILDQQDFIGGENRLESIRGEVEFRNVDFAYAKENSEQGQKILRDISFHLPAGHSLALVGATGSGKSTIIKLLTKLYDGYGGEILVDKHDLRDLDAKTLRKQVAIVPQDITLFDGSISFNIGMGLPFIDDSMIAEAAKKVGADLFIDDLPGGYDFRLKEQGSNLSHGQRQLIVFARALAKDPKMVILDEATSSVDSESEALIQRGIATMLEGRTVVVIAHRLSTIKQCDQIMVIGDGNILESGGHDQLIAAEGVYHQLYNALG